MFAKLEEIERSFEDLEKELGAPEVASDPERYRKVAKSHADLGTIVRSFREYKQVARELEDNRELLKDSDPEMREMARHHLDITFDGRSLETCTALGAVAGALAHRLRQQGQD